MSHPLVSHSADLTRLVEEGYEVEIRANYLLVTHVPYATAERRVAYGTLISELSTNGTSTTPPSSHVVWFAGSLPCDNYGRELTQVINSKGTISLAEEDDVVAQFTFSSKPASGYADYYQKMTSYIRILMGYARALDDKVDARTFPLSQPAEEESVFRYLDSASSRAGISGITAKLRQERIAIVGLGGTGSYVLDLLAKTPIGEIHLYDEDVLFAHNAFRTPGAASLVELAGSPTKVEYLRQKYDPMRRGIFAHGVSIGEHNVSALQGMDFVFLSMDGGPPKEHIIGALEASGIPFIDSGMGIYRIGDSLGGIVRVTASTDGHRAHVRDNRRISFGDQDEDEYDRNVQTADLNMLNAALAVVKWKKLRGFYVDLEREHHTTYTVSGNQLLSEDQG